ncbi:MAG: 4-hydroxythreonine-4-phosphate dehydrogenase [Campylobacterales bacterium]|nr:4-hydroxythreonine-4-phosphate dehydrogenase [Campylobacterales bacterium]
MSNKPTVAVSVGDLNGIGFEIVLKAHTKIFQIVNPIYFISKDLAKQSADLLNQKLPKNFQVYGEFENFKIKPSKVSKKSGNFSFESFKQACDYVDKKKAIGVVTMPINKESWGKAGLSFVGHTDYLKHRYQQNPIMMLGCEKMFVALFTDHVPLNKVPDLINTDKIYNFLLDLSRDIKKEKIAVLGINPHCGDGGVLGDEDSKIQKAIEKVNKKLGKEQFIGTLVPDTAFTKANRERYKNFVAMYHDQGLTPLKALYFDESINVSLNLPIKRSSVDHGTAFDIAYKDKNPSVKSYLNAVMWLIG